MAKSALDKLTGAKSAQSEGSEDFDFMGENEKTKVAGKKPDNETATSGNPESGQEELGPKEPPVASTMGEVNLAVTLEARKRAASSRGLVIDEFVKEFKLLQVDIEHLLNGPLPIEDE